MVLYFTTTLLNHHIGDNKMMNLLHRHRAHIPNGFAILAALMLLVTSVYGINSTQTTESNVQQTVAATTDTGGNTAGEDLGAKKRRGLNLGLLLFRR
jgi:hypothetical protein